MGTSKSKRAREKARSAEVPKFSLKVFLSSAGPGRSAAKYKPKKLVFRQGEPADSVFFIQSGKIEISVISKHGKEGVVAMLGAGDFFS
jgi:CRP-like cAMP-binding protein